MAVLVKVIRHSDPGLPYLRNMCSYGINREIARGGYGVNPYDPQIAYSQMQTARQYYTQMSTNPLIHIVVSFDGPTNSAEYAIQAAPLIAAYFKEAYQLIWSVHPADEDSSHYHMHILLHSVNMQNGNLFHSGPFEIGSFAYYVREITGMPFQIVYETRENW